MNESDKQPSTQTNVEAKSDSQVVSSDANGASESANEQPEKTKNSTPKRAKKSANASAKPSSKNVEKQTKRRLIRKPKIAAKKALLILLVALLAAALAYAAYWLKGAFTDYLSGYETQQTELIEQLAQQAEQIARLQSELSNTQQGWQQASAELEQLVVDSAQRLNQNAANGEQQWPMEEALTLTRLAQQRLQLDGSATMAVRLLRAADTILAGQDQAAVLPLRRQLTADILALNSLDSVDLHGHYFALEAIAEQIRQLTWLPKPATQTELADELSPKQGFIASLKQIVVIQRLDVPMQAAPLQSSFEQWRQQTLLRLEQTQLALLARNQPLYDSALQQSQSLINEMRSQVPVDAYLSELQQLSTAVLNPDWPDISASTELIEQYISTVQVSPSAEASE